MEKTELNEKINTELLLREMTYGKYGCIYKNLFFKFNEITDSYIDFNERLSSIENPLNDKDYKITAKFVYDTRILFIGTDGSIIDDEYFGILVRGKTCVAYKEVKTDKEKVVHIFSLYNGYAHKIYEDKLEYMYVVTPNENGGALITIRPGVSIVNKDDLKYIKSIDIYGNTEFETRGSIDVIGVIPSEDNTIYLLKNKTNNEEYKVGLK